MKKKVSELSSYFFIFILGQVNFFLLPIYTHYMTAGQYGLLEISFATINSTAILYSLGLHQYIGIRYFKVKDKALLVTKFSYYYILLSFPLMFLTFLVGVLYGNKIQLSFSTLTIIVISAFVLNFRHLLISVFNMSYMTKRYFKYAMASTLLVVALTALLYYASFSVNNILLTVLLSNLIFFIYPYAKKNEILSYLKSRIRFDKSELSNILKISIPLVLVGFFSNGLTLQDRYFLSYFLGNEKVGIYSLAYKTSSALFILLSFLVGNLYMRAMYKKLGESKENIYNIYRQNLKIFFLISLVFGALFIGYYIFLYQFSKFVINIYSDQYYALCRNLLVAFYLQALFTFFSFFILFFEKVFMQSLIYLSAILINGISNYSLIPIFGVAGATYTAIITNSFLLVAFALYSYKLLKINKEIYANVKY